MQTERASRPPAPVRVIVPVDLVAVLAPRIADVVPGAQTVGIDASGTIDGDADDAIALFRYFPYDRYAGAFGAGRIAELLAEIPALRLLQSHSAGVDGLLSPALAASDCALCNAASLHSGPLAEVVMALMLSAAKRIPFHVRNQATHTWQRIAKDELRGSTVGIVGFGRIGATVGQLCAAFGMRVLAVRQSAMAIPPHGIERVAARDGLDALLAEADWVVLTLPLTPASRRMIGARELALLKPKSRLINVARGEIVDEAALTRHLQAGRIAYACLDAFEEEPLPATSPLWDLPNVLVTPHNSASSPHMERRVIELFLENLRRLAHGAELLNVVDKTRGH